MSNSKLIEKLIPNFRTSSRADHWYKARDLGQQALTWLAGTGLEQPVPVYLKVEGEDVVVMVFAPAPEGHDDTWGFASASVVLRCSTRVDADFNLHLTPVEVKEDGLFCGYPIGKEFEIERVWGLPVHRKV